jgi:hypothetical protein
MYETYCLFQNLIAGLLCFAFDVVSLRFSETASAQAFLARQKAIAMLE